MSGTSGNEDGYAGTIFTLECTGYHYHFGGGKPTQPTVTLMQHAGALAFTEQEAPCNRLVRQGSREEAQAADGGGAVRELGESLPGLRVTIG